MEHQLYSLRMRAEQDSRHCCGAERIVPADQLPVVTGELVARALACGAMPTAVHCSAEQLVTAVLHRPLPAVQTFEVADWATGRVCACRLLVGAGVSAAAAEATIARLAAGPAPGGGIMRGAMIVDAHDGARLEGDPARGVRVSRMDLAPDRREALLGALAAAGLGHHRTAEALVLAGKVLQAPGIVAELCWSDDPSYLVGYVADPRHGYQRITRLKAAGDGCGGRALFVQAAGFSLAALVDYLERQPVLFDELGAIAPPQSWRS